MNSNDYTHLYDSNKSFVFKILRRKGVNVNDAQELTHVVLTKFILNIFRLKSLDKDSIAKYLTTITKNTFLDYVKKKKHSFDKSIEEYVLVNNPKQDDYLFKESISKIFDKNDYNLIDMYFFKNLNTKEISEDIGLSQRVILYKIKKIKTKLKEVIKNK